MRRRGKNEWAAVVLLPLIWVAGVVLLWRSRAWSTRDKLVGTLLVPGGVAFAAYVVVDGWLLLRDACAGPDGCYWSIDPLSGALVLASAIVPPLTATYLAFRADLDRTS